MTTNQIAYYKAREDERHNRAMEQETQRSNVAREAIDRASQQATAEHYKRSDTETLRSNLAREGLQRTSLSNDYAKLQESKRSNLANEAISRQRNAIENVKAQSGAYLDYSTAGLRQAETSLKDLEASYTIAKTSLTNQQAKHEAAQYYDTLAHVNVNNAQRDYITTQTAMEPIKTTTSGIGNVLGGLGRTLGATGVQTEQSISYHY